MNILFYSVAFIEKINQCLRHWCFPGKFMNFSETAPEVLYENSKYPQEGCRPATLFKKRTAAEVFSSEYWEIFKNIYFEEHLLAE